MPSIKKQSKQLVGHRLDLNVDNDVCFNDELRYLEIFGNIQKMQKISFHLDVLVKFFDFLYDV